MPAHDHEETSFPWISVSNRLALVTGADSGIGWHTAQLLLAEGHHGRQ